jgi:hypothetical protein
MAATPALGKLKVVAEFRVQCVRRVASRARNQPLIVQGIKSYLINAMAMLGAPVANDRPRGPHAVQRTLMHTAMGG